VCQTRACGTDHQCHYTPITGAPSAGCNGVGQLCCGGVCKTNDPNNCGACGKVCPANSVCTGGQCVCNTGFKPCGNQCIANSACCTGTTPGCGTGLTCCVANGQGVCQQCCGSDAGTCPDPGVCKQRACSNGTCQPQGVTGGTCPFASGGTGECSAGACICPSPRIVCSNGCCPVGATACKTDGTCGPGCDVCPSGCPFTTLAAAVTGTADGGTIRICPGTYATNQVTVNKNLTIIGAGAGSDPTTDTILSGGKTSGVLSIVLATVTIQDLTVTDGTGTDATGGIGVPVGATLNLVRVEIVGNTSTVSGTGGNTGGGLGVFSGCTAVITDSRIANNTTQGGDSAVGGGIFNSGTVTLGTTRVEGNTALGGGGIFNAGKLTLNTGAVITKNTATKPVGDLGPLGSGIYNKGTITGATTSNVFDNIPTTNQCTNEAPATGCPA
jgi:hypothetical protein